MEVVVVYFIMIFIIGLLLVDNLRLRDKINEILDEDDNDEENDKRDITVIFNNKKEN